MKPNYILQELGTAKSALSSRFEKLKLLNMQKDAIVKILSILQCQKYSNGIRIILENLFSQLETTKNPFCSTENLLSMVSRIVPNTPSSPLCSQNLSFSEKSRVVFDKKFLKFALKKRGLKNEIRI